MFITELSDKIKHTPNVFFSCVKELLFKWADNSTVTGSVMEFMDLGDAAPNDRYAFHYVGYAGETASYETEEILTEKAVTTTQSDGPAVTDGEKESEEKRFPVIEIAAVAVAVIAVAAAVIIKTKKK